MGMAALRTASHPHTPHNTTQHNTTLSGARRPGKGRRRRGHKATAIVGEQPLDPQKAITWQGHDGFLEVFANTPTQYTATVHHKKPQYHTISQSDRWGVVLEHLTLPELAIQQAMEAMDEIETRSERDDVDWWLIHQVTEVASRTQPDFPGSG